MASLDLSSLEIDLPKVKETIEMCEPKNMFITDETGFYYRVMPCEWVAKKPIMVFKMHHERITLAFTVPMLGEKLKPMVIGHAANLRILKDFGTSFYVDYNLSL